MRYRQHFGYILLIYDCNNPYVLVRFDLGTVSGGCNDPQIVYNLSQFWSGSNQCFSQLKKNHYPRGGGHTGLWSKGR